jgi:septal ring-binding cell division protein DamX
VQTAAADSALVSQHLALYADWLANAGSDRFFIQLTARSASHTDDIERFLARAGQSLEPAELRVYRRGSVDNGQIGVIYGDYPTRAAAWAATRSFPETIRRMRPYPRQVSALQQ